MIVIAAAILGIIIGGMTAKRRNGNGFDIAQYAAGYMIAFALVGLVITITLEKML